MIENRTHVLVLGAGYAGLLAAVRLAGKTRKQDVAITLVNAADHFVERLRLHQFAANRAVAARPIVKTLEGTGVEFVQGVVTGIDPTRHAVVVEAGGYTRRLAYDKMVYALGSTIDRDSVPGVRDHAFTLTPAGPRSATELREVLPSLNVARGRVVIGGGGATGIEAAAEFAGTYPNLQVTLITRDGLGRFWNDKIAAFMRRSLDRLGVITVDHTVITEVRAGNVQTASGETVPYDLCLWTGGFSVPAVAREAGLRSPWAAGSLLSETMQRSRGYRERSISSRAGSCPMAGNRKPLVVMARSLMPRNVVAGSHRRSTVAIRSRMNRFVVRIVASSGCRSSGSTKAYERHPGPCKTVPPPLARRKIGMPSPWQAARSTSSINREARPSTTK